MNCDVLVFRVSHYYLQDIEKQVLQEQQAFTPACSVPQHAVCSSLHPQCCTVMYSISLLSCRSLRSKGCMSSRLPSFRGAVCSCVLYAVHHTVNYCTVLHVTTALQDIEKQVLQEQQAAFMSEVEQWSQGEVEAIQAAAAARLQEEQATTQHW
jgi:hypothetical protein